eukprot:7428494-Karenia_brevis.AAC.1
MPAVSKVVKWTRNIELALSEGKLSAGHASKLAGQLSWAVGRMFKRFGRAMIRPIFDQKSRVDGQMSEELIQSLKWWVAVLRM